MRRIPLRARDGSVRAFALVDDEDHEAVRAQRWCMHKDGYAQGRVDGRMQLLHRVIVGLELNDPREVDHKNRVRLDCRRENLRIVAGHGPNRQNVAANKGAGSRFRGVVWDARRCAWDVRVQANNRRYYGGTFADELTAARRAQELRAEVMPFAEPDPELVKLGLA